MENMTVLVTGGSGFLGQHIVKHLHLSANDLHISEIRILDVIPYTNKLDYKPVCPVKAYVGSLLDEEVIHRACKDVHAVLHIASFIDTKLFPDVTKLTQINVKGTQMLLDVCAEENVRFFVYCSSVSCVQGCEDFIEGTEETLPLLPEDKLLFRHYGGSKQRATRIVLKSDGQQLPNGNKMRTVVLLPVTMYGELDQGGVTIFLKTLKKCGGSHPKTGSDSALLQFGYVGNVAWGFICGLKSLAQQPDIVAGQYYLMGDDTPVGSLTQFMEPFLECRGFRYRSFPLPFIIPYFIILVLTVLRYILLPVYKINADISYPGLYFMQRSFYFTYQKAKDHLSYTPLYSVEEGMQASKNYYSKVNLN